MPTQCSKRISFKTINYPWRKENLAHPAGECLHCKIKERSWYKSTYEVLAKKGVVQEETQVHNSTMSGIQFLPVPQFHLWKRRVKFIKNHPCTFMDWTHHCRVYCWKRNWHMQIEKWRVDENSFITSTSHNWVNFLYDSLQTRQGNS